MCQAKTEISSKKLKKVVRQKSNRITVDFLSLKQNKRKALRSSPK